MSISMRWLRLGWALLALVLAACTTLDAKPPAAQLDLSAQWVLLPFANHTETPLAGQRAEAIAEPLLRTGGVARLDRYPPELVQASIFEPTAESKTRQAALDWARGKGARYAVAGAVDEWRYKVGVDGEPAVGVALQVIDLSSGQVVWSGVGGKSGWSRDALSGVAQKLMRELLTQALAQQ